MSIVVQRSGVTASHYNREMTKVRMSEAAVPLTGQKRGVKVHFTMASKGGGRSDVLLSIPPSDFAELAQHMFDADPDAAIRAFGLAMQAGIK